jgi:hypothetical protein
MMLTRITTNRYYLAGLLGLMAAISLAGYLIASILEFRIGFPLDDAWIHQTYARNLVEYGSWVFLPDQPSAGSTAPAWSIVIALGHWLNLGPHIWIYLLGWLLLWGLAVVVAYGFTTLIPHRQELSILAGALIIFEWHLTWAAGSGMETLFAATIYLVVLLWALRLGGKFSQMDFPDLWPWFGLGALIGFSVWVRPDGITLFGVVGFILVMKKGGMNKKLRALLFLGTGSVVVILPYLIFNFFLVDEIWPSTYYAKQVEYAIYRSLPYWRRYLDVIQQPLTGVGFVLLPGFLWFGCCSIRNKDWGKVAGTIWVAGFIGIYAWRLPVSYQHGRYIMPVMPAYFLFGLVGIVTLMEKMAGGRFWRVLRRSWVAITGIVLAIFWLLGARAYAWDVAVIESEMVDVARWITANTEADSLIAAHDIGALGYFGDRDLLDLAGLVSPEVIPYIRDEKALANYLDSKGANYLVTFPSWYTTLVQDLSLVYRSEGVYSPAMGGENMSVFTWE